MAATWSWLIPLYTCPLAGDPCITGDSQHVSVVFRVVTNVSHAPKAFTAAINGCYNSKDSCSAKLMSGVMSLSATITQRVVNGLIF